MSRHALHFALTLSWSLKLSIVNMKIIIAGSKDFISDDLPKAIELSGFAISEVVCGGCRGPDTAGEVWAHANRIPCVLFHAG